MKTAPLHPLHIQLKAKFTEFAGYQMSLQYSSIVEEVMAVRSSAGLFDISHMGRLWIRGKDAKQKLDFLTTNSLDKLKYGKVQYNLLVNEREGVKDDITVYMMGEKEYFLCVNSINREKVLNWLSSWGLTVEDWTFYSVQIALQGRSAEGKFENVIIFRTGYTGEDGFEIYAPIKEGIEIFEALSKEVQTCRQGLFREG